MDNNLKIKLEQDAARGDRYKQAWENFVEPFFEEKQKELYEVFRKIPTSDTSGLHNIKYQSNALDSLRDEFQHYINTGTLAQKAIEEDENE